MAARLRGLFEPGLRRIVERAVTVGSAQPFGRRMQLCRVTGQLEIEWHARGLHPWDDDLPFEQRSQLLRAQTIEDTDVAVARLFRVLPEVETIAIRVRGPESGGGVILAGTVNRASVAACSRVRSPHMRLKIMGVRYEIANDQEALTKSS
jgi:hypothetical protein